MTVCAGLLHIEEIVLTEAVLLTGSCGARVGLCGCSGFTEAPEGGLYIHRKSKNTYEIFTMKTRNHENSQEDTNHILDKNG